MYGGPKTLTNILKDLCPHLIISVVESDKLCGSRGLYDEIGF